jgi:hypothetical protein
VSEISHHSEKTNSRNPLRKAYAFARKIRDKFPVGKEPREYGWDQDKPVKEVIELIDYLEALGLTGKDVKILDAGAGTGRNSMTFLEKGYAVESVEQGLKSVNKMWEKYKKLPPKVRSNWSILGENIEKLIYFKNRYDVIVDYGMSHLVSRSWKNDVYDVFYKKLQSGGFLLEFHFEKDDPTSPHMGMNPEEFEEGLRSTRSRHNVYLPPEEKSRDRFTLFREFPTATWTGPDGKPHKAWYRIYRKENDATQEIDQEEFLTKLKVVQRERIIRERKDRLHEAFDQIIENYPGHKISGDEAMHQITFLNRKFNNALYQSDKLQQMVEKIRKIPPVEKSEFIDQAFEAISSVPV